MNLVSLDISIAPRRMLTPREAAQYCRMPLAKLKILSGISPVKMPHGKELFDLRDLDTWIDSLKRGGDPSDSDILERLG